MSIIAYEPATFDDLPTFEQAQKSLASCEGKLGRLATVISDHGGDERLGLCLLHRHFDLDASERIVERIDVDARRAEGLPRSADELAITAHLFAARRSADGYEWTPLEFVDAQRTPSAQANLAWLQAPEQRDLLDALAEALCAEGVEGIFGLALDHGREEIPLRDDEVLVEETFTQPRRLLLRPTARDSPEERSTPTGWSVRDGEVIMRCTCQTVDGRHNHFETN